MTENEEELSELEQLREENRQLRLQLAEQAAEGYIAAHLQLADRRVEAARSALSDACALAATDDTGQDYEAEVEQAAADYIAAQDQRLRQRDPEQYEEMRQMGMLR